MNKNAIQVRTTDKQTEGVHPIAILKNEIENVFEKVSRGWSLLHRTPQADAAGTERCYEITIELPGMDETDIDVSVVDSSLVVTGEKREQLDDIYKDFYLRERSYGSFQRLFEIPEDVDGDHISAQYEQGVLRIDLPRKSPYGRGGRHIKINQE